MTEMWQEKRYFYGDGYSFVFTFRDGDDLELFPASGECEMFQQSDKKGFIIGGSESMGQQTAITV